MITKTRQNIVFTGQWFKDVAHLANNCVDYNHAGSVFYLLEIIQNNVEKRGTRPVVLANADGGFKFVKKILTVEEAGMGILITQ